MPRVTVEASHTLGLEEALRRLTDKAGVLKDTYRDQFSDLHEEWNGDTLSFRFQAAGMKIGGTVAAEHSLVKLDVELPLVVMVFKGMIQARVKEELGNLLA
jgi:putative polyhydroxyalkanoate system protein